jgi:hypothetical protein
MTTAIYQWAQERIHDLCRASWKQNKKRSGYSVPEEASVLISLLDADNVGAIKSIKLHGYFEWMDLGDDAVTKQK